MFSDKDIEEMRPSQQVKAREANELYEQGEEYFKNSNHAMALAGVFYLTSIIMLLFDRNVASGLALAGAVILFLTARRFQKKAEQHAHVVQHFAEDMAREALEELMDKMKGYIRDEADKEERRLASEGRRASRARATRTNTRRNIPARRGSEGNEQWYKGDE